MRKSLEKNGIAKENLRNRRLKDELEKIVKEECAKAGIEPKTVYNIFIGVRYTGEQIKFPETEWVAELIRKKFENENNCKVFINYRSLTIKKNN